MGTKHNCANCRRDLDVGVDMIRVDEGVMGNKGFVPLDSTMYFCCDKCLKDYFDLDSLPNVPYRVP